MKLEGSDPDERRLGAETRMEQWQCRKGDGVPTHGEGRLRGLAEGLGMAGGARERKVLTIRVPVF